MGISCRDTMWMVCFFKEEKKLQKSRKSRKTQLSTCDLFIAIIFPAWPKMPMHLTYYSAHCCSANGSKWENCLLHTVTLCSIMLVLPQLEESVQFGS